jgi:hypothetical protein
VRCPQQRCPKLVAIKALAAAAALSDEERLPLDPFVRGNPVTAGGALPAPPGDASILGAAALENPSGTVATRTLHDRLFYYL